MSDLLSKVQLIKGTPPCQPGKCAICGNCGDMDSEFLDFGLELDFYGVVYFCSSCVMGDVLSAMDLVLRERLEEVQDLLEHEKSRAETFLQTNIELRGIIDSLTNNHGFVVSDSGDSSISEQPVVDEKPETAQSAEPISRKSTATKSRSAKQTNVTGSTSVRNDDGIKEFDL